MSYRLGDLANQTGARLEGDIECRISSLETLQEAASGGISFLANRKYRKYLKTTKASAVILSQEFLAECPTNALVSDNPYLIFAHIAELLAPKADIRSGQHASAIVAQSAQIDASAWIGPGAIIEDEAEVGARACIGPGCVVGRGSTIGEDCRLLANVSICHGVELGCRVLVHPGAVIGSDGFGLANDNGVWVKVPQLGSVCIGDDVEIGANTTIDRGAIKNTVIEHGVKLDNQVQIAHNVSIGAHTAVAACVGIAGSTRIGRHCTLAGGVGVVGHLNIADDVHFSAQTLVTRSFPEPGYYSGNLPAAPNSIWRKTIAGIRRLDWLRKRVKRLEQQVCGLTDKAK
ncbi:UDP-3-O-[3-hydroxymyristoyl] glucosamine N-acyltransferase [hydrothermal vent metagenome]|uniref:UDP-3-O-[3-hydroxymyristoyl] glucosamine N-acyltransferase n=1 Tax=hydrothermal vent metagenome TaxID=652676 RepID=A0A3B1BCH0_9ZZZZ